MSVSVFRSPRVLIVGGVAVVLAFGGAGLAYASTGSSPSPSSATSGPTKPSTAAKQHKPPAEYLVTAISGSSLTADTPKGAKTFTLTSTTYHRGTPKVTEGDIQAGQVVRIRTAKDGTTARSVSVAPAVITGYVQNASGSTLTVVDRSGLSHPVSTTGATYTKGGAAGQAGDVTPGALVRGFLASDGATIDATTIGVR